LFVGLREEVEFRDYTLVDLSVFYKLYSNTSHLVTSATTFSCFEHVAYIMINCMDRGSWFSWNMSLIIQIWS